MPSEFTVSLDRKEGFESRGHEIGGSVLRGKPVFREGQTGVADSMEALLKEGLVPAPTYRLIGGRAFAGEDEPAWQQYHDTLAERITAFDPKGILGKNGATYVLDIQNGGLFVRNHPRIRDAVNNGQLVNRALQLSQEEVNAVLDAIKKKDYAALKQIVQGENFVFSGNYGEFKEESSKPNFLDGMSSTYLVIRNADEARKVPSGYQPIDSQRDNPDLIIASGGKAPNEKMLDRAKEFKWKEFGSHHDGYQTKNGGRVVGLDGQHYGLWGSIGLDDLGLFVGVAPEARDAFYKGSSTDPLTAKVLAATRGNPVPHHEGVLIYVPNVALKQ
ncbi:hypothetical protein HYX02_02845 [Candidatus Woesearchaeota archaeon]|nr:hypothetical protein [Candidatus Woesearchaeota archaeon]